MCESVLVTPVSGPVRGCIRPPGSKSLTNRALVVAALAVGRSRLTGVLDSDDTRVMIESLGRLGIAVRHDAAGCIADVTGSGGRPPATAAELWLAGSGTGIRFLTAVCTLGRGTFRLDGNTRMRQRPIRDLLSTLNALGADAVCELGTDCPPVTVQAQGLSGGTTTVASNVSSQFLSAVLMAAPCAGTAVELHVQGDLVSRPYVDMTLGVMSRFGATVEEREPGRFRIAPQIYRSADYEIEPDASAASYFFAAAAITGGEVRVDGLSRRSRQGDVGFVDVLQRMGCRVEYGTNSITVQGGTLRGLDADMNAISDTAQTLAVVAAFASGPTRIRNVAHIRHKETDRIEAVACELRRLGLKIDTQPDGMTIQPGPLQATTVRTYDDHRMAMSFALLGLKVPGIRIADPQCTAKTYPNYFTDLQKLCRTGEGER